MIDVEGIAKRIGILRRERGYTGEALAQRLGVSPQAVSKWENARCLPETAIVPALAQALDCSIDSLLCPRELFILEAVYTDGCAKVPVTRFLDSLVRDNALNIYVNTQFIGACLESDRLKLLTVKFQTPRGISYAFALENENLILDKESAGFAQEKDFQLIGAYYGNGKEFSDVMRKMEHYEYFNWDRISVNQETFPGGTASEDTEYLTLVYLNARGIHVISCPENGTLSYGERRTRLFLADESRCVLKGIERLAFGKGMECPWAGALFAALSYMGEPFTYYQIMGMSGACFRLCFTDVWDYSCTDALVAFDYAPPFFRSIGYSFHMADRVEKGERRAQRLAIMEDIRKGRPVLAINLRVAPEWGIITGYVENGTRFLCRTYFDRAVFDALEQEDCQDPEERRMVFEDNEGYLFSDNWPFLILHFGQKEEPPLPAAILKTSLVTLIQSFHAGKCRGYYQGKEAYEEWIRGLSEEEDFCLERDTDKALRRLDVNDSMLCQLADSRQAAASWLRENIPLLPEEGRGDLERAADNCQAIAERVRAFRNRVKDSSTCAIAYNCVNAFGVSTGKLRREQIRLLTYALSLEEENCALAGKILEILDKRYTM